MKVVPTDEGKVSDHQLSEQAIIMELIVEKVMDSIDLVLNYNDENVSTLAS